MTREEALSYLEVTGTPRHELAGKSMEYLEARVAIRRRDGALGPPLPPVRRDALELARVQRFDVTHADPFALGTQPGDAELVSHFDRAQDLLENFVHADAFAVGAEAAWEAAIAATYGGAAAQAPHADEGVATLGYGGLSGEDAALARHFDQVMGAAHGDYDNSPPPATALQTSASLERGPDPATLAELRAKSERDPLSAFIPLSEFERLSAEQRAKLAEIVKATVAELLGQGGSS